jgi:hypothetical protein
VEIKVSQAIRDYTVYPSVLHRLIAMGKLRARKDGDGRWLIERDSLENWNLLRLRRAAKRGEQPEVAAVVDANV